MNLVLPGGVTWPLRFSGDMLFEPNGEANPALILHNDPGGPNTSLTIAASFSEVDITAGDGNDITFNFNDSSGNLASLSMQNAVFDVETQGGGILLQTNTGNIQLVVSDSLNPSSVEIIAPSVVLAATGHPGPPGPTPGGAVVFTVDAPSRDGIHFNTAGITNAGGTTFFFCHGGPPAPGEGFDGAFAFQDDGGALTTIYQKRAGAWVGIL